MKFPNHKNISSNGQFYIIGENCIKRTFCFTFCQFTSHLTMKKYERNGKFRMLRLLFLCSLLFSPNHHGLSFKISRQEKRIFQLGIITSNTKSNISILEISGELETKSNPTEKISWIVIVAVLFILVVSPYLGVLGIRSLKDQPLDKQSVLNQLCRDCTVLQIVFVVTWAMYIVTAKFIDKPEHLSIFLKLTNIICYINEGLFFLGMLYVSLIGSLRLYTIVYQVLDPL